MNRPHTAMKKIMNHSYFQFVRQNLFSLQFYKYVLVGISNAVFSTLVYFFCLKILEINYLIAFTISWLAGVFYTYLINFLFIFKPGEKLEFRKRLPKYFIVYCASYSLNIILLKILVSATDADPFWLQFLILPLVIVINFTGFKYWALK
jgi:putative flippase GtrA